MAEVLVSAILKQLARITGQLKPVVGTVDELQKLTSNFQSLHHDLGEAERKKVKDHAVRDWLDTLIDTSYDIDDVLDEWITWIEIKGIENSSKHKRKVCSFIPCHNFCSRNVVMSPDIAFKIKKLNGKLDIIAKEKNKFNFCVELATIEQERKVAKSIVVDYANVLGRDHDKDTLLMMLLNENSQATTIPIISIVGMGGIGKTTLAQLAFNNDKVQTHFDQKIWVHVSKTFDEIRIAKTILESLGGDVSKQIKLGNLLQEIRKFLTEKKFFLVLDDVWTENLIIWKQLRNYGSRESRILVTTRKKNVAKIMGTMDTNMILLGLLSKMDSWSLFSGIAFFGRNSSERENLEDIGRKIVSKCKGLPLALRTLGNLLKFKSSIKEWQSVLDREMWELKEVKREIFPYLLSSYYDLHYRLRKCFSYCTIFPKNYKIEKNKLVKLWIAQGYIGFKQTEDIELVGEKYFEELAMYSFFQDFEINEFDGSIESCKMHDIMHDFVQFLTKIECFSVEINNPEESRVQFSCMKCRHLMLILKSGVSFPMNTAKGLRSLVVECENMSSITLSKIFRDFTSLRTLDFSNCGSSIEKIPIEIKNLLHLRYLNLSHNAKIEELPETLCELHNLQTLDVSNCYHLQKLPDGIEKLIDLRHLINHGTCIGYIPRGIQKLTCLQQLTKFVVSNDRKACRLESLANFKKLGAFLIITGLGNVSNVNEVNQGKLEYNENIFGLGLRFDGWLYAEDEKIFKGFRPPQKLQELMIKYYTGRAMPLDWMKSLTKLRVLKLSSCFEFVDLPALGTLSSLESLSIWNMTNLKKVDDNFLGVKNGSKSFAAFLKLKYLTIWNMEEWEEWNYNTNIDDENTIMPTLHSLILYSCPKLKELPDHFLLTPTLPKPKINGCPLIEERYKQEWGTMHLIPDINNSYILGPHDKKEMEDNWPKFSCNPAKFLTMSYSEISNDSVCFGHSEIEEVE